MRRGIFFILLLFLIFPGCRQSTKCEKEIFLLPKDFHGRLIVFFDQKDGQEKAFEGDARLYKVPQGGLMKSRFPKNGGCMSDNRIRFFYVDSLGQRAPLLYFLDMEGKKIPADSAYVVFSLLSNKGKNPFVIHLVGSAMEFKQLTNDVKKLQPEKILKSL